jgi:hypothetical protein
MYGDYQCAICEKNGSEAMDFGSKDQNPAALKALFEKT